MLTPSRMRTCPIRSPPGAARGGRQEHLQKYDVHVLSRFTQDLIYIYIYRCDSTWSLSRLSRKIHWCSSMYVLLACPYLFHFCWGPLFRGQRVHWGPATPQITGPQRGTYPVTPSRIAPGVVFVSRWSPLGDARDLG